MTLLRGYGAARAFAATLDGDESLADVLLAASMTADVFDGVVARRLDAVTNFGAHLDALADLYLLSSTAIALHRRRAVPTLAFASLAGVIVSEAFVYPTFSSVAPKSIFGKTSLACVYAGSLLVLEGSRRSRRRLTSLGALLLGMALPLAVARLAPDRVFDTLVGWPGQHAAR